MNKRLYLPLLLIACFALPLLACNLASLATGGLHAEAAEALETEDVAIEGIQPTNPPDESQPPAPIASPTPSTPPPTPTPDPTSLPPTPGCTDRAQFVADVTIPDDASIEVGAAFTKTWRLRNSGTCTWTSSYALVFSHGDLMGGPPALAFAGSVNPGNTVDLTVDLTAPAAPGTYQGYWMLRNNTGLLFGLGSMANQPFWVKIKAVVPPPFDPSPWIPDIPFEPSLPIIHEVTLDLLKAESGSVYSYGTVKSVENVGDLGDNRAAQVFLSFDISAVPEDATIAVVEVDFSDFDTLGAPFGGLGCLRAYVQDYEVLDSGDYFGGIPSDAILRWCNQDQLGTPGPDDDVEAALQAKLGQPRFQLRVQFNEVFSDADFVADMVRLGDLKLIVTYTQ